MAILLWLFLLLTATATTATNTSTNTSADNTVAGDRFRGAVEELITQGYNPIGFSVFLSPHSCPNIFLASKTAAQEDASKDVQASKTAVQEDASKDVQAIKEEMMQGMETLLIEFRKLDASKDVQAIKQEMMQGMEALQIEFDKLERRMLALCYQADRVLPRECTLTPNLKGHFYGNLVMVAVSFVTFLLGKFWNVALWVWQTLVEALRRMRWPWGGKSGSDDISMPNLEIIPHESAAATGSEDRSAPEVKIDRTESLDVTTGLD